MHEIDVFLDNCKYLDLFAFVDISFLYDILHASMATRCLKILFDNDYVLTIRTDF